MYSFILALIIFSSSVTSRDQSIQLWIEGQSPETNQFVVSKHEMIQDEQFGHVVKMNGELFDPYYMKCYSDKGPCSCDDEKLNRVEIEFMMT